MVGGLWAAWSPGTDMKKPPPQAEDTQNKRAAVTVLHQIYGSDTSCIFQSTVIKYTFSCDTLYFDCVNVQISYTNDNKHITASDVL